MSVGANTYAEHEDVERLIGDIVENREFTTDTVPSLAQVEQELDNAAMELNRELDWAGYTVPVDETDYPTAYGWLKSMNEYGAAAMLLNIGPAEAFESAEDTEGGTPTRAQTYANRFKDALKYIKAYRLRAGMRKHRLEDVFSGSQEDADGNEKLPVFRRGDFDYPGRRTLTEST